MNSTFCTDLVSLFVNHIFDCDSCFDKTIGVVFLLFGFFGLMFFLFCLALGFFEILFRKIVDRFRYKKAFDDLASEHTQFLSSYDSLLEEYNDLALKYAYLEKEYYHTCN